MTSRRALVSGAILALALVITSIGGAVSSPAPTPVGLTAPDVAYTQNFDTLVSTGSSNALPTGWGLSEAGTSAANDGKYTAGTGSGTGGDTYSFGAASSTERALGTLLSGTLTPTIGAAFTNNTGGTITSIDVAYRGSSGASARPSRRPARLPVQPQRDRPDDREPGPTSTRSTSRPPFSPRPARWTATRTPPPSPRRSRGLAIPAGQTFWIRWNDFNASGADDGLAVDDFSLTPHTGVPNALPSITCGSTLTTQQGTPASRQISASDTDGDGHLDHRRLRHAGERCGLVLAHGPRAGGVGRRHRDRDAERRRHRLRPAATPRRSRQRTTTRRRRARRASSRVTVTAPPVTLDDRRGAGIGAGRRRRRDVRVAVRRPDRSPSAASSPSARAKARTTASTSRTRRRPPTPIRTAPTASSSSWAASRR